MKKIVKYFVFTFILLILSISVVGAASKKYKNGDSYIVVDKSKYLKLDDTIQYEITDFSFHGASWNELGDWQPEKAYFFTDVYDAAYRYEEKWWANVYVCKSVDWGFLGLWATDVDYAIYTSSLLAEYASTDDGVLDVLAGKPSNKCLTYTLDSKVANENLVNTCSVYESMARDIFYLSDKYASTKNISYKNQYKEKLDYLKSACNQAMASADWNDACVNSCSYLSKDTAEWNKIFNPTSATNDCGFSDKLFAWILNIMKWVKYILPVLVIILGIIDFIKAIGADKDDEIKKAQGRFLRRLIAAALVFLVPLIIEFVLKKFGFDSNCGLF